MKKKNTDKYRWFSAGHGSGTTFGPLEVSGYNPETGHGNHVNALGRSVQQNAIRAVRSMCLYIRGFGFSWPCPSVDCSRTIRCVANCTTVHAHHRSTTNDQLETTLRTAATGSIDFKKDQFDVQNVDTGKCVCVCVLMERRGYWGKEGWREIEREIDREREGNDGNYRRTDASS